MSDWTPAQISTTAWYDASDANTITANESGAVSQWDDKSGNGNHATQGTGADQPITDSRTLNGLNVIDFDGFNDYFSVASLGGDLDYIVAYDMDTVDTSQSFFGDAGASTFIPVAQSGSLSTNIIRVSSVDEPAGTEILYNGATSQTVTDRGEVYTAQSAANIAAFTSIDAITDMLIGRGGGSGYSFEGGIAEIVIIPSNTTNRQVVEGYLAHKWGLVDNLPNDHPYKSTPPLFGITMEPGSYSYSGTDASLSYNNAITMIAGGGAYTLTGTDAALTYNGLQFTGREPLLKPIPPSRKIKARI